MIKEPGVNKDIQLKRIYDRLAKNTNMTLTAPIELLQVMWRKRKRDIWRKESLLTFGAYTR